MNPPLPIESALKAVGDLLLAAGEEVAIVVVGGATMILRGIVRRGTNDVDVIARASRDADGSVRLSKPEPFPKPLQHAIRTVARDFQLSDDWMNAEVGAQWVQGVPPLTLEEITWRTYGNLHVGLAGRQALIALKLFAAVDSGPGSVHVQDLLALKPTDAELEAARHWVAAQDAYAGFAAMVAQVIEYVRRSRS